MRYESDLGCWRSSWWGACGRRERSRGVLVGIVWLEVGASGKGWRSLLEIGQVLKPWR